MTLESKPYKRSTLFRPIKSLGDPFRSPESHFQQKMAFDSWYKIFSFQIFKFYLFLALLCHFFYTLWLIMPKISMDTRLHLPRGQMHGKVSRNFSILFQVDQPNVFCLNNGFGKASYHPVKYTKRVNFNDLKAPHQKYCAQNLYEP